MFCGGTSVVFGGGVRSLFRSGTSLIGSNGLSCEERSAAALSVGAYSLSLIDISRLHALNDDSVKLFALQYARLKACRSSRRQCVSSSRPL